jgi:hypothetical protein
MLKGAVAIVFIVCIICALLDSPHTTPGNARVSASATPLAILFAGAHPLVPT